MKKITPTTSQYEIRQLLLDLLDQNERLMEMYSGKDYMPAHLGLAYEIIALFDTGMILWEGQRRPDCLHFNCKTDRDFRNDIMFYTDTNHTTIDAFMEAKALAAGEDTEGYIRELGTEYYMNYQDDMEGFIGDFFTDFNEYDETFNEYMIRTTQQLNREQKINNLL